MGQALIVLTSPLITRLYSPAAYGALAVFASLLFLLITLASLRYEDAIPLAADEDTAASATTLSLGAVVVVSLLLALLVAPLSGPIAAWTDTPGIEGLLWLLPLGVLAGGGFRVLSFWAIRVGAFGLLARTAFLRPLVKAATQVGLGLAGVGTAGLVVGEVLGQGSGVGALATLVWRRQRDALRRVRARHLRRVAARYRAFPLFGTPSAVVANASVHLPALLVAGFYGAVPAGWLALTLRVITMPMVLLSNAVGQVYLGRASRLRTSDPRALRRLYVRTALVLLAVGSVPAALLLVAGPPLFTLVFGGEWGEAGLYAQVLVPMFLAKFVVAPLAPTLNVLERQGVQLWWDVVRLVASVGSLVACFALGAPPVVALAAYAAGTAVANLGLFLVGLRWLSAPRGPRGHEWTDGPAALEVEA